ncbi:MULTISPECIES: hypothetical protein [unclassified Rhodococcus (in: high G+C Gram-positive bacteria)]|uniref:hypothetical protein n=1 Tax=unclassified Rhodococcus (in: high G+C Gram-positive bacteria) TaxID=192944 RepID=UPI0012E38717|nr:MULTISPECIES: hypothetical protein [unclassified Rhodococcus (in: high G+C Gram-positive bacteria)]
MYNSDHIGRTVAVRAYGCLHAGKLTAVTDSMTDPLIVLQIGTYQTVAVHPSHRVTVAPVGCKLTVTAVPKADPS